MINLKTELIDCIWDNTNTYTHLSIKIPYPICGFDGKLYWILTEKRIIYIKIFEDVDERPFNSTKNLEYSSVDKFVERLQLSKQISEIPEETIKHLESLFVSSKSVK